MSIQKLVFSSLALMLSSQAFAAAKVPVYYCSGTEPFWSLKIHPKGIKFEQPDGDDPVRFTAAQPSAFWGFTSEFAKIYRTRSAASSATIIVTPGGCNDGMSDHTYSHTVMMLDSKQGDLSGCCDLSLE